AIPFSDPRGRAPRYLTNKDIESKYFPYNLLLLIPISLIPFVIGISPSLGQRGRLWIVYKRKKNVLSPYPKGRTGGVGI
ncbi:MAG: hypothetical protein WCJ25_04455, partial [Candidatus Moraniibacteriota bacterium]